MELARLRGRTKQLLRDNARRARGTCSATAQRLIPATRASRCLTSEPSSAARPHHFTTYSSNWPRQRS